MAGGTSPRCSWRSLPHIASEVEVVLSAVVGFHVRGFIQQVLHNVFEASAAAATAIVVGRLVVVSPLGPSVPLVGVVSAATLREQSRC